MKPRDLLQSADTELGRLTSQLVNCQFAATDSVSILNSVAAKLTSLRREIAHPIKLEGMDSLLRSIRQKTARVTALLEAATAFHCNLIFGQPETADTYTYDGTLQCKKQASQVIFEG